MRVAFISFEFPPAIAIGGIGAYASEAVRMLVDAGNEVEVFAGGTETSFGSHSLKHRIHRIRAADRATFRDELLKVFTVRHKTKPFEVLESPEVGAEGLMASSAHPELPVVVKLHTPSYLISDLTYEPPTLAEHLRFTFGAARRGRIDILKRSSYTPDSDIEAAFARRASWIAAPSQGIADRVGAAWALPSECLTCFPLPYRPPRPLLDLVPPESVRTIGFLGRLEPRKGIIELAEAIPKVLTRYPGIRFRMLGPSWPYKREGMQKWMLRKLGRFAASVDFVGAVDRGNLAIELSKCDAIVLPSRWENFPFACWESMAAGRLVIGSSAGGMADVIRDNIDGRLVRPYAPVELADTLIQLIESPEAVGRMAASGRSRVQSMLAPETVLPLQIQCYNDAISNHTTRMR